MKAHVLIWFGLLVGPAVGCSREATSSAGARPAAGAERGDCTPGGGCASGLLCLSNLCVRPPPADCQTIADLVTSMDLGNYATPEDRAPVAARYKAACAKGLVSKDQGACLEAATDKWAAAQCAPSMFPELAAPPAGATTDCGAIVDKLRVAMSAQMGNVSDPQITKMLTLAMDVVRDSCREDGWPDVFKQCILASASTTDAMTACENQMPPGLQQKMTTRMQKAMQPTP